MPDSTLVWQNGVQKATVQHMAPTRRIRPTDPQYGLRTSRDDRLRRLAEDEAKREGIRETREKIKVKEADINRLNAALVSGNASDPAKVKAHIARLTCERDAMARWIEARS